MKRQQELTDSEIADHFHLMQTLINSIASPIFYKDYTGIYRGCNKAFEQYIGKSAADIIGKSVYDLSPRELAEKYERMDRELLAQGQTQNYETFVVDARGERRAVLFNKAVYYDRQGQAAGIVGVILDITERKKIEEMSQRMQEELKIEVARQTEALRQANEQLTQRNRELKAMASELATSEEKFSKAFYYCAEVVGIIGLRERKVIEVNEAFFRIFGYAKEEVLGRLVTEINIWADPECGNAIYQKMLRNETFCDLESTWRCKNGERRIGLHSGEFIELGGEQCALFVWHDITARKRAELELEKMNAQLEEKVAARTMELSQKINELTQAQHQLILQEKMAGIGLLAAGMAHEINNPLGFVLSNFQMLRTNLTVVQETINEMQQLVQQQDFAALQTLSGGEKRRKTQFVIADMQDICNESETGLRRISDIIKALRSFSRFDVGSDVLEYDINEGVRMALTLAGREMNQVGSVQVELGEVPRAMAAANQINQVLLNIVVNAAQAVIAAQLGETGSVSIRTDSDEQWVRCAISNNGLPIPPEISARIFDPFFTTKAIGDGIGIGLSLSYDIIVNRHCGRLSFSSTAEQGTTFLIELPLAFCPAVK